MDDTQEILLALGRLEGKVEALLQMQSNQDKALNDLDKRVRLLEQGKAAFYGGAAVIGASAAAVISWVFKELNG